MRYPSALRAQEILVLQGSPMLGLLFAAGRLTADHVGPAALLAIANLCLVAHIFALNDWADHDTDAADPHKSARVFTAMGVGRVAVATLSIVLGTLSLMLFQRLGRVPLSLAVAIVGLSALYSLARFRWKARPLLNTAAHLAGGAVHFLLGYSVVAAVDRRGLALAAFFGLVFAAGHLTQEVRDHAGDVVTRTRTNAVWFGPRRTFLASLVLFAVADAVLFALALGGVVPRVLAATVLLAALQFHWSRETLARGLTYASVCRLQVRYRALYVVIGVAMAAALWVH